jgi:hypothetical protein
MSNRKRTKDRKIQTALGKPTKLKVTQKPRLRNILAGAGPVLRQIKHPKIPWK